MVVWGGTAVCSHPQCFAHWPSPPPFPPPPLQSLTTLPPHFSSPSPPSLPPFTLTLTPQLEERSLDLEQLWDMEAKEIGAAVRHPAAGRGRGGGRFGSRSSLTG